MYRIAWCMIIVAGMLAGSHALELRADVVVLHDGSYIEGEVIGGTANQVYLRRASNSGGTHVEVIDRAAVAWIDRREDPPATRPVESVPDAPSDSSQKAVSLSRMAPPASRPSEPPEEILSPETHRAVIMAIAKWRAEDFVNAGMDLSRLINSSGPDQRAAMSTIIQANTGKSLAELAADAHFRAALANRRGPAIRLAYITEYEKPALIPKLVAAYEAALIDRGDSGETVGRQRDSQLISRLGSDGQSRPDRSPAPSASETAASVAAAKTETRATRPWYEAYAQTRPAPIVDAVKADDQEEESFAVVDWWERPNEFEGSVSQARDLAPRVHRAINLLNERVRLDSALRRDAELKRQLMTDRQRLTTLSKTLAAYSGKPPIKSSLAEEARAAEEARREQYEEWRKQQQEEQAERLAEAQEAARKWREEQEAKKKFSLFDWLKPQEPPDEPQP